jgi:hypothetical protein
MAGGTQQQPATWTVRSTQNFLCLISIGLVNKTGSECCGNSCLLQRGREVRALLASYIKDSRTDDDSAVGYVNAYLHCTLTSWVK